MATQYGAEIFRWLLSKGWLAAPTTPDEERFGDPLIVDPQTSEELNPYTALRRHYQRTGEWPTFLPENYK